MATNIPLNPEHTFKHISVSAVHVLARMAARRAVQEELHNQGVRVSLVKPAEISAKAQVYLQSHPELYREAMQRAHLIDEAEGRKKARQKLRREQLARLRRPVLQTDSAQAGTEKTQVFSTTSAIFRGSCLLIAF
jgi:hypothetical protein